MRRIQRLARWTTKALLIFTAPAFLVRCAPLHSRSGTGIEGGGPLNVVSGEIKGVFVLSTEKIGQSPMEASIYSVHADGTNKKFLTGKGSWMPSWTPDGRIIYVSASSGSPQIWIMNEDGRNPKQIGNVSDGAVQPQMAKNGLIVFGSNSGIWSMKEDGSDQKKIVSNPEDGVVAHPSLALSGTWITYTAYENVPETTTPYQRQIWRINTDGTDQQQLTFRGDPDYPDGNASMISPDEKWIAIFTGKEDEPNQTVFTTGHRNVGIMSATGGSIQLLTACEPVFTQQEYDERDEQGCIMADDPVWSADSQWIIHSRANKRFESLGTWVVDITGQNSHRLFSELRGYGRVVMRFLSN
ncbi:MAG: hypothetical protein AB7G93_04290 [Bdellovibrionales bacterium]